MKLRAPRFFTKRPSQLTQVVLLRDRAIATSLGPVLWTALREAGTFWQEALDITSRRFFVAPARVSTVTRMAARRENESVLPTTTIPESAWRAPNGRDIERFETEALVELLRQRVDGLDETLVVLTDCELDPPNDWRYMIWDWDERDKYAVISIAPLDPEYWGVGGRRRRISDLKHRARTAAINACAPLLGVDWCRDVGCLLNDNVAGVGSLDAMAAVLPNHSLPKVEGRGFDSDARDPLREQSLAILEPRASRKKESRQ